MKMKVQHILWLLPLVYFTACSLNNYDNYDKPESTLEGILHYEGDPIRVSSDNVTFELWETGFGSMTPIEVTVDQDGSYSAVLFDGDYKLIIPSGQGPFRSQTVSETNSDTLLVQLQGSQNLDIEVIPYYMIRDFQFSVTGNTVSANVDLEQIITDENAQDVEYVEHYISKTNFVDVRTSISNSSISGADISDINDISLSTEVPDMTPSQDYVFTRVGVKINNVEDMIFSDIEKIEL